MTCEVYSILTELASTPKKLAKLEILAEHKESTLLVDALSAALDPYTAYNIRKIPKYTSNGTNNTLDVFLDALPEFSQRKVTGNAAILRFTGLLENLSPEAAIVAERIIKGDLRCGVQKSTVNKIHKGLIPTYPCLLAKSYDEKSIQEITYPAYSELKADGMRANAIIRTDKNGKLSVVIRGRSGKFVDLLGHLDAAFAGLGLASGQDVVFDGELVVLELDGTVMSRKKGNGLLNKAIKGTMTDDIARRVRMRVWDMIDYESFMAYKCNVPYSNRCGALRILVGENPNEKYELIEQRTVASFEEAILHYEDALMRGEEGTMLKNMNHIWQDKRSKDLVKFKVNEEADLIVTGWKPGTPGTKNEGKMGSLVCESSDGKVIVNVSGFSDELRDEITANMDQWVGQIVTILYNERISSESRPGIDKLFLPRFQELRLDKDEADHSSTIK